MIRVAKLSITSTYVTNIRITKTLLFKCNSQFKFNCISSRAKSAAAMVAPAAVLPTPLQFLTAVNAL